MGLLTLEEKQTLTTLLRQLPYRDHAPMVRMILLMKIPSDIKDNIIFGDTPFTNIMNIVEGVDNEDVCVLPNGQWPVLLLIENVLGWMAGEHFSGEAELKHLANILKVRARSEAEKIDEIDEQALEERWNNLIEDYQIVSEQSLTTMSARDKVRLNRILAYLEQEIKALERYRVSKLRSDIPERFLAPLQLKPVRNRRQEIEDLDTTEEQIYRLMREYEETFTVLLTSLGELEKTRARRKLRQIEQAIIRMAPTLDRVGEHAAPGAHMTAEAARQTLHQIKQDWLERLLGELAKEYLAASNQKLLTLNPSDKLLIDRNLTQLERQIESIEAELSLQMTPTPDHSEEHAAAGTHMTAEAKRQTLLQIKQDRLERLLSELSQEHLVVSKELACVLNDVDRLYIERSLVQLEQQIESVETELHLLES